MLVQILEQLSILIEKVILSTGYVGIALVVFIENIFPPIPSELIIPFSGFLVNKGELNFVLVFLSVTAGAMLGAITLYYLGVALGEARTRILFRKYGKWILLSEKDFDKLLIFFNRYSGTVVFWARFMPGIRSIISIPAGIARMNFPKFLLLTFIGSSLWNLFLLIAGVYLGQNWEKLLFFINKYEKFFYLLIITTFVVWFTRRLYTLKKTKTTIR